VRGNAATAGRPETIEETAELVSARGGAGLAMRVDHTVEGEVAALFERVAREQDGRLDILVNDVWGGDEVSEWGKPFWENSLRKGLLMQDRAVRSHIITAHYGAPLMVARGEGLIVEVTDGTDYSYRGNLFYSLAKVSNIHLAAAMAADLRPHGVVALSVTPGFLRSEAMLDHFGVTEENWREGAARDPHFIASETPYYVARGVVALVLDPRVAEKAGRTLASWDLAHEYCFTDVDGSQPHWGNYYVAHIQK
jgi:NAD(P)-dependent dehydrogenase (short-subunit alcohol dehydrogenase family)